MGSAVGKEMFQILKEDGSVDAALEPHLPRESLEKMYWFMLLTRALDGRGMMLQRQGRIGFYAQSLGEEATHVGSAFALEPTDWVVPEYREQTTALVRGIALKQMFCLIIGNSGDLFKGRSIPGAGNVGDRSLRYMGASAPVGTQIPIGVGAAIAAKYRRERTAFLIYFGDGATSTGDFHVGMNFAGVFKAPAVLFCKNNQYAISVPFSRQTASESVAIKATAYGFEGILVDGNDVLGVYTVTRNALQKAISGGGPTLIEALTYRLGAHTTADDPTRYRDPEELESWLRKDPVKRFQAYLEAKGILGPGDVEELAKRADEEVSRAYEEASKIPPQSSKALIEDVYSEPPWHLADQLEQALR